MDVKKGTTTIVLVCKNGVVFAADKQASLGDAVSSRTTRKIFQVTDSVAVTIAGSLGDAQNLVSLLKGLLALKRLEEGALSTKTAASLTSRILHENRFYPYIAWLLLAGYDEGPRAFSIDPLGGLHEDTCITTGSGMQVAQGVLEDQFTDGLDLEEGIMLAVRAVRAAQERDLATGGGIAVSVITPAGYKEFSEKEIEAKIG